MTKIITQFLSVLVVAGQATLLVIIASRLWKKGRLFEFISRRAILFSLIVSAIATMSSLYFSEIAGYEPCKLCWFQRIFMYPQVLILAIALAERHSRALIYSAALSAIGVLIAGYHYLLQIGIAPALSCGTVGYSVSCAEKFVMNFGYITIPMMALTTFLLILTFSLIGLKSKSPD